MRREWKEGDWRVAQARSLISSYRAGKISPETLDTLVLRILKHFVNEEPDEDIAFVLDMRKTKSVLVDDIASDCISKVDHKTISNKLELDLDLVELIIAMYCDFDTKGGVEHKYVDYARNLPPAQKKRFEMKRKFGKFFDPIVHGMDGTVSLDSKDIMAMVSHALQKAFVMGQIGPDVELDSPEHKTVLAYNNLFIQYTRLLTDLEASNTDSSVILQRMAEFTSRIPKEVPVSPVLQEVVAKAKMGGKDFKLAPKEDVVDEGDKGK